MTRRSFISLAAALSKPAAASIAAFPVVPVRLVLDKHAKPWQGRQAKFWAEVWPEAVRDLKRGGVMLSTTKSDGEIVRPYGRQPVITGLAREALNVVVTDQIPLEWDNGRMLNGVTTLYRGHHLCVFAMNWAHAHQVPVVSVNTCLHEILHALLGDIFEIRPQGWTGQARELRVDSIATRLWLFGDGSAVREPARDYVERLQRSVREFFG
jgi:hypothetical protein